MDPVCLIIPPSLFLLDERVFMTLGILRVASVLEKARIPVEVLDLSGIENFTEAASYQGSVDPEAYAEMDLETRELLQIRHNATKHIVAQAAARQIEIADRPIVPEKRGWLR